MRSKIATALIVVLARSLIAPQLASRLFSGRRGWRLRSPTVPTFYTVNPIFRAERSSTRARTVKWELRKWG